MKMIFVALLLAFPIAILQAIGVRNLDDKSHLSGPKLTEKDLEGRVVAVEVWGVNCPPCRASLPHIGKLAASYEKDNRVVIIGAHAQGRDDARILELLDKSGCEYPVYQFFGIDGAPSAGGLPFAYVMNHKGEFVWKGNPYSGFKDFESAIAEALKAVPKLPQGSLLVGLDIQHCKDVAKRLVAGQNAESVLRQLQTRAARGGAAGEEAKKIIERCTEWATETEATVREAMETLPSKALADAQIYVRTFPKQAAALSKELATLAKDPITKKLSASRAALAKLANMKATTANARKKLCAQAKMQLRQLSTLGLNDEHADYQDVKTQWENFLSTMSADE